jgi:hypothetical protein
VDALEGWFNPRLAAQPFNWLVVWTFGAIALLGLHVVMQGHALMKAGSNDTRQAPGQTSAGPPMPVLGAGFAGMSAGEMDAAQ